MDRQQAERGFDGGRKTVLLMPMLDARAVAAALGLAVRTVYALPLPRYRFGRAQSGEISPTDLDERDAKAPLDDHDNRADSGDH